MYFFTLLNWNFSTLCYRFLWNFFFASLKLIIRFGWLREGYLCFGGDFRPPLNGHVLIRVLVKGRKERVIETDRELDRVPIMGRIRQPPPDNPVGRSLRGRARLPGPVWDPVRLEATSRRNILARCSDCWLGPNTLNHRLRYRTNPVSRIRDPETAAALAVFHAVFGLLVVIGWILFLGR